MKNEIQEQWYEALIEECKAIITETIFTSRWALVEGYHKLGERILEENNNFERKKIYGEKITTALSESLGTSTRTIERAILFAKKYPDLDKVPEGKNISWNKICTKYLPAPKENKIELPPPKGLYNVIVIDPPWPYSTEYDKETRRVASPYKELSIEELANFKIPAADNCILWLWTTHKFLPDAFNLSKLWYFDYKITLVWDKEKLGMGVWLRCQTEFCLLCIKGKPKWNLTNERDIIRVARKEHSRKPTEFYNMVKQLCSGKKIDIFGREKREGFDVWGDQSE